MKRIKVKVIIFENEEFYVKCFDGYEVNDNVSVYKFKNWWNTIDKNTGLSITRSKTRQGAIDKFYDKANEYYRLLSSKRYHDLYFKYHSYIKED